MSSNASYLRHALDRLVLTLDEGGNGEGWTAEDALVEARAALANDHDQRLFRAARQAVDAWNIYGSRRDRQPAGIVAKWSDLEAVLNEVASRSVLKGQRIGYSDKMIRGGR